jgi:hypothetical protein
LKLQPEDFVDWTCNTSGGLVYFQVPSGNVLFSVSDYNNLVYIGSTDMKCKLQVTLTKPNQKIHFRLEINDNNDMIGYATDKIPSSYLSTTLTKGDFITINILSFTGSTADKISGIIFIY